MLLPYFTIQAQIFNTGFCKFDKLFASDSEKHFLRAINVLIYTLITDDMIAKLWNHTEKKFYLILLFAGIF